MQSEGRIPSRIPSLDGLRAASIALVLAGHTVSEAGWAMPGWLAPLNDLGAVGVAMFFVLSGFLITRLLIEKQRRTGDVELGRFYLRRAYRIWPAFYCFVATVAVLGWVGAIPLRWTEVLASGFFLWNVFPGSTWFLGHTWTIAIEEQFYFLWPVAVKCAGERGLRRIALGLILSAPLVRVGTYLLFPAMRSRIPLLLPTRVDILMFGALAALLYDDARFQRRLQGLYRLGLPCAAACFMLVLDPVLAQRWQGRYLLPVGWSLEGVCLTLVMLWAIQHAETVVGRALNWGPVVHLGVLSYSLYLWQQMFLASDNHTFSGHPPLNLLCAVAAAAASYWGIERPFLRMRERRAGSSLTARAATAGG